MFSMTTIENAVEEFKEHESPQPNCKRYSMSPKDNKLKLQGSPLLNSRPQSCNDNGYVISLFKVD